MGGVLAALGQSLISDWRGGCGSGLPPCLSVESVKSMVPPSFEFQPQITRMSAAAGLAEDATGQNTQ